MHCLHPLPRVNELLRLHTALEDHWRWDFNTSGLAEFTLCMGDLGSLYEGGLALAAGLNHCCMNEYNAMTVIRSA